MQLILSAGSAGRKTHLQPVSFVASTALQETSPLRTGRQGRHTAQYDVAVQAGVWEQNLLLSLVSDAGSVETSNHMSNTQVNRRYTRKQTCLLRPGLSLVCTQCSTLYSVLYCTSLTEWAAWLLV